MYTLILILSLKSQFHHDIDIKQINAAMPYETSCDQLAEKIAVKLKAKNPDLEVDHLCERK